MQQENPADTIAAIATAPGRGAIGVIRVSGPRAFEAVNRFLQTTTNFQKNPRKAQLRIWLDGSNPLDEILVTGFPAPYSFTGEETVELAFHGSPYILRRALQQLSEAGVRTARPGEFTRRAFLNGKMDLSQAEAVADLIAAESQAAAQLALHNMRGGFSKTIRQLREKLIEFASLVELELDFAEEDVEFADRSQLRNLLNQLLHEIRKLAASYSRGQVLKEGVPVAIVGAPNAGKSTLLNALLNEEKAIVSDIPGTTRDAIEDTVVWQGIQFRFIDTAGIRETGDVVENIGIQRSLQTISKARVVLHLVDLNQNSAEEALVEAQNWQQQTERPMEQQWIFVASKADLLKEIQIPENWIKISAAGGEGLETLQEKLCAEYQSWLGGNEIVIQARHAEALNRAAELLGKALEALITGVSGEFMAMDMRDAISALSEIVGDVDQEEVLGAIFSKFCIGK